jgi:hypothetical protein
MSTIVTRAGKGSPLTHAEVDANFTNLNTDKLETSTAASTYAPLANPTLTGTPVAPTAAANTNTTQLATTAFVIGQASSTTPVINGTAAVGTSLKYARADHVHGSDTSKADLASPTFTGTPAAPTAAANTNTTQLATTAFVLGQGNSTAGTIAMNGTQAAGTSNLYARADHVHPSDTTRAALAGATFTGAVTTVASATGAAGFNLPHGSAPTTPVNGDLWSTTTGLFLRVNGTTRQYADFNTAQTLSSKTLTTPTINGVTFGVTSQTSAYTATASVTVILCSATTAAFTVTLPTAASVAGRQYTIKKTDSSANAVTVGTTSSQTIDGSTTYSLPSQYNFVTVVSDGANWMRIG